MSNATRAMKRQTQNRVIDYEAKALEQRQARLEKVGKELAEFLELRNVTLQSCMVVGNQTVPLAQVGPLSVVVQLVAK